MSRNGTRLGVVIVPVIASLSYDEDGAERVNHKKSLSSVLASMLACLFVAGCGGTTTIPHPTATASTTLIPPTATTVPSPSPTPTPTAIPGSHDPLTVGNFTFRITEVRIADVLTNLPAGPISNYRGNLKIVAGGYVPTDAKTGDKLLLVFTTLQSGIFQTFIDTDPKLVAGDSKVSNVAILTQADNNIAIWVFGVNPGSKSFLLAFPGGTSIDLGPITP